MQSVQNLGLAVITTVAGIIVDSGGYLLLEVFFLGWLCSKYMKNLKLKLNRPKFDPKKLIFNFFFSFFDSYSCNLDL